jgi:peptidoglycan/LPS O-acetylase OafA/YrhL
MVEYLRGLASLSVAWFHLTNSYEQSWVAWSGSGGFLGVQTFFVISGFVIPYALATSYQNYTLRDMTHFLGRRLVRIEPPYTVSVLMVVILWYVSSLVPGFQGQAPNVQIGQLFAHLFYVIPVTKYNWLQPVYWTLAYEFAFYIVMAFLFPYISGSSRFGTTAGVVAILILMVYFGLVSPLILLFTIGFIVYRGLTGQDRSSTTFCLIGACTLMVGIKAAPDQAIVALVTALLILFHRHVTKCFSWAHSGFIWLGGISYSLYLVHVPIGGRIVNIGKRFIHDEFGNLFLSLAGLGVSLIAAAIFCRLIEKPSIWLAQKLLPNQNNASQKSSA